MSETYLIYLAILGPVDESILTAVVPQTDQPWRTDPRVLLQNGRLLLPDSLTNALLRQLEADPNRYQQLHQQLLATLTAQIAAGADSHEAAWTAVFERLANRYFATDTPALLQLVQQASSLPLQTAAAQQTHRYFQGVAAFRQDAYDEALDHFDRLLAIPNLPQPLQARTLNARAVVCRVTGRLEEAMAGYEASLTLWQALGDNHYQGIVHLNLGIIAYGLRRYSTAVSHLEQAAQFFQQAGSAVWVRKVQSELGLVQRDLGNWAAALAHFDSYVKQSRAAAANEDVGLGEANRGEVLLFQGALTDAKIALQTALDLVVSRTYRVDHLLHLGLAHQAENDLPQAEQLYREALQVAQEINRQEIIPHVYYHLGDVRRRQGETEEAVTYWTMAAQLIESSATNLQDTTLKISLLGRWQQVYEALVLHHATNGAAAAAFEWSELARARAFADLIETETAVSVPVLSLAQIQAALPANTALLSFFTTGVLAQDVPLLSAIPAENPLRDHILPPAKTLCFVVTREQIRLRDCELNPNQLQTHSPRGVDLGRFLKTAVRRRLYQALFAGVSAQRWLILPHGPLHRLPLTALFPEAERPLLQFAPSATIFARQHRAGPPAGHGCLLVGSEVGAENGRLLRYTTAEVTEIGRQMGGRPWSPSHGSLSQQAAAQRWLHFACHGWFNEAEPLASYLQIDPATRLTAREVLETWQLSARLVTLSACETGVSQILRGDEPMGLVRAFLAAGAQTVLVSQWRVDDLATYLLMRHFYDQLDPADPAPDLPAALHAAQTWLQTVTVAEVAGALQRAQLTLPPELTAVSGEQRPFADPFFWAGFRLVGG